MVELQFGGERWMMNELVVVSSAIRVHKFCGSRFHGALMSFALVLVRYYLSSPFIKAESSERPLRKGHHNDMLRLLSRESCRKAFAASSALKCVQREAMKLGGPKLF